MRDRSPSCPPKTMNRFDKIIQLLSQVKEMGCSCDLMIGWYCQIHEPLEEIRKELERLEKNGSEEERIE